MLHTLSWIQSVLSGKLHRMSQLLSYSKVAIAGIILADGGCWGCFKDTLEIEVGHLCQHNIPIVLLRIWIVLLNMCAAVSEFIFPVQIRVPLLTISFMYLIFSLVCVCFADPLLLTSTSVAHVDFFFIPYLAHSSPLPFFCVSDYHAYEQFLVLVSHVCLVIWISWLDWTDLLCESNAL